MLIQIIKNMETKNITIVGGGSAGWMTATTLLNQFPNKKITLVESPNISNVGVGESTAVGPQHSGSGSFAGIIEWFKMVGIDDSDFMPQTDAVYKLSIAFENWYRKDSGTFHYPFGQPRFLPNMTVNKSLMNAWHLKKIFYPETPVSDYAEWFFPTMALVNQNKSRFTDNFSAFRSNLEKDELNNEVQLFSAHTYQFDASKLGIWLKDNYCKAKHPNNFTHILAEVVETPLNDNGIKHLVLDNGQKLEADLFIDCTGFQSLLLTKAFGVPFINIENYIPNNYAWATKIPYKDPETQIVNYTLCTAIENGWTWEIPLWSRMGSGYVFSDKFISTQAALREFKQELRKKGYENVEDLEYRLIPMRCGIQSKLWVKNTCAIGLAAGFIEPLQSNGIHNIYQFLFNLLHSLSREHISEWDRAEFTTKCHDDFYNFASIVAFTYALSHRDDTEYWREINNREWPIHNTVGISKHLHEIYVNKNFDEEFNPEHSAIHCMAAGMNWNPIDIHTIKYNIEVLKDIENIKKFTEFNIRQIEKRKRGWDEQIKDFPSPYQYLKNNIHINS